MAMLDNRLKNFAQFFKGYMSVMPLVTAALAPVLTLAKAIPVFASQKTSLATFSGLFGFLLVAWVFFARDRFVPAMTIHWSKPAQPDGYKETTLQGLSVKLRGATPRWFITLLPLGMIVLSAYCYISYSQHLDLTLDSIHSSLAGTNAPTSVGKPLTRSNILQTWGTDQTIPHNEYLQVYYLGIFLCAELAFVFMALREYAYGTLNISELEVLTGERVDTAAVLSVPASPKSFDGDGRSGQPAKSRAQES